MSSGVEQAHARSPPDYQRSHPETLPYDLNLNDLPSTGPSSPSSPSNGGLPGAILNPVVRKGRQGMWSSQSSVGMSERTTPNGTGREFPLRPRTKTVGERYTDESRIPQGRSRMGSAGSSTAPSFTSDPGIPRSQSTALHDYPSFFEAFQPMLPSQEPETRGRTGSTGQRQRLVKLPPRPDGSHRSISYNGVPTPPPNVVIPDMSTVFGMMKSNRGRMRGMLQYKTAETDDWSKGSCFIDETLVSLVLETAGVGDPHRVLVSDLRTSQIRSLSDSGFGESYIEISRHTGHHGFRILPVPSADFDAWVSALLYWQCSPSEGRQKVPQLFLPREGSQYEFRRKSELSFLKDASIIKVGKMVAWDPGIVSSTPALPWAHVSPSLQQHRVSSILRENGEFKLYTETEIDLISTVQLSQLTRSAIQRLDPSVLGEQFCIAILPQTFASSTSMTPRRPVYLSLDSRVLFEVWFLLLRAFTRPELCYPEQISDRTSFRNSMRRSNLWDTSMMDLFRVERTLSVRVVEAKLQPPRPVTAPDANSGLRHSHSRKDSTIGNYFSEIFLDGEVRARTLTKYQTNNPFWREDFKFSEIGGPLPRISILFKKIVPNHDEDTSGASIASRISDHQTPARLSDAVNRKRSRDLLCGRVDIRFENVGHGKEAETWWPIINRNGENIGEMLLRVRGEELALLISQDYDDLAEILQRFSNGVTLQIAQILSAKLHRVSEIFLNIFQASGRASDWLMALVEEEFDGTYKDSTIKKLRFSRRAGSGESHDSTTDRELIRELGRAAPLEANLLFRGNNLLTKSLDLHLQRVGKEYLEETLAEIIKEVNENDYDCEVDPNRIVHAHDLKRNWRNLTRLFAKFWSAIRESAQRCPMELRIILRHVQACAEDRFELLRTVKYSSVSGFLFLRFFCPAVLNPRLFGLLKDNPKPRAQRALTLIAKSLQGLGNMSSFGVKESWMEPMNQSLSAHRQEFKDFIDAICSIPIEYPSNIPPSYATPTTILSRMTSVSREGCPSLPYLIDSAHNFAALVNLWIEVSPSITSREKMEGDLLKFHLTCIDLHQRTQDLLSKATQSHQSESHSPNWEDIFQQLQRSHLFSPRSDSHPQSPSSFALSDRSVTPTDTSSGWQSGRLLRFKVRSDDELSSGAYQQSSDQQTAASSKEHTKPRFNDFLSSFRRKAR
ncbi:MAG: Chitin synthase, class 1 [Chaenotheca gracillima]|nr:MAG: Chitin synthase, class 1 [Chaenotheca gracillima]